MNNNESEYAAGFALAAPGQERAVRGRWLRDLAIALAVALVAAMLGLRRRRPRSRPRIIQIGGNHRTAMVTVTIGKSQDVRTDNSFVDVTVGDPDVADVNPLTDHTLSILGKKIGTTRVSVYGEGKKLIGIFDVEVTYDVTRLTNELKRRFPRSHMQASTVNGRIMLSGEVADAATLDKAVTIARQFGPEIINSVAVMPPQQVMLEVRFIEVARNAGRELGVQWNRRRQPVRRQYRLSVSRPRACRSSPRAPWLSREVAAGVLSGSSPFGFAARAAWCRAALPTDVLINALEQKGVARSLAEPNLVALSGDTASFLAGGEYPIPVAGTLGQVTVDYKKYGVGLAFTPTVLGRGLINMKIEPEVSPDRHHPYGGGGQRHLGAGADRAPRLDHGRAARRPELRDRRPAAERRPDTSRAVALARQRAGARRVVLVEVLSEERDRSRHHRHAASGAAGAAGRRDQDAARQHAAAERRRLLPARQDRSHAGRRRASSRRCPRASPPATTSRSPAHARSAEGGSPMRPVH